MLLVFPTGETLRMANSIHPIGDDDRPWVRCFLTEQLGSTRVASRGRLHQADRLPGFIASCEGAPSALLAYRIANDACEVVALYSAMPKRGLATGLLAAARTAAVEAGCRRLWLVTTNDNQPAADFYARRGFELVTVHPGAVDAARRLKPELPEHGVDGMPIRDELEFEMRLAPSSVQVEGVSA